MVVTEGAVEKHVPSIFQKLGLPEATDDTAGCWRCSPTCK